MNTEDVCEHCEKPLPIICEPFCDACYFGVAHMPECPCGQRDEEPYVEYAPSRSATKDEFFWGF